MIDIMDEHDNKQENAILARIPQPPKSKRDAITRVTVNTNELRLPSSDGLTLEWLWRSIPIKYWAYLISLLCAVFIVGVYAGQFGWIKNLINMNRTEHFSAKSFPEQKSDSDVPKGHQFHIEQKSKGNQSPNIVTKGNVDIRIDDGKLEK